MSRILSNAHTHTKFCDGLNTAEEMVQAAIKLGFTDIGFSGHSPVPFQDSACMSLERFKLYCNEINRLKEQYKSNINISLGLEVEYYCTADTSELDYTIGALHWIQNPETGKYYTYDDSIEMMNECINEGYGGDAYALVADYYRHMAKLPGILKPDIIAHFDLVTKFNRNNRYFDENSDKYKNLALEAVDSIAKSGCIVEVNTGGMFRGYTEKPYPAPFILKRLSQLGVSVMLASDAHCTQALDFRFIETTQLIKGCGYKSVHILKNNKFEEIEI